jgi:hypothetical protein
MTTPTARTSTAKDAKNAKDGRSCFFEKKRLGLSLRSLRPLRLALLPCRLRIEGQKPQPQRTAKDVSLKKRLGFLCALRVLCG